MPVTTGAALGPLSKRSERPKGATQAREFGMVRFCCPVGALDATKNPRWRFWLVENASFGQAQDTASLQICQPASGVAQVIDSRVHSIEHREPEVVERGLFVVANVPARAERAAGAADEQDR